MQAQARTGKGNGCEIRWQWITCQLSSWQPPAPCTHTHTHTALRVPSGQCLSVTAAMVTAWGGLWAAAVAAGGGGVPAEAPAH